MPFLVPYTCSLCHEQGEDKLPLVPVETGLLHIFVCDDCIAKSGLTDPINVTVANYQGRLSIIVSGQLARNPKKTRHIIAPVDHFVPEPPPKRIPL